MVVFDGVLRRRMQSNTMYVVYNGWKVGGGVVGMCMVDISYQRARSFWYFGKLGLCSIDADVI